MEVGKASSLILKARPTASMVMVQVAVFPAVTLTVWVFDL